MRIFNTLTGSVEEFDASGEVDLYVCGVTPYDTTHLGHARTYLVFDVLVRHLLHQGHRVRYVQNITDVDDSILERARELGEPYEELGRRYLAVYLEDSAGLGIIPADVYPTATSGVPQIVQVVEGLLASGHAYQVDGDVFFRVASFGDYGTLGRLGRDEMIEREREQDVTTADDPRKEDRLDFLLWRAHREGEPSWDSPWGSGRPGWHIECSTLALSHLGGRIDIHGGGTDLIFPHHENEIAQSEAFSGMKPFARFWVHVAMAQLDGRKMSKSEGNMIFVRDLLREHSADAVRMYLLQTHYRTVLEYDLSGLETARELVATIGEAARVPVTNVGGTGAAATEKEFQERLEDDLDTPGAIEALRSLAAGFLEDASSVSYGERKTLRSLAQRLGMQLTDERPEVIR
jgi:cysteinyl-tRNA synthetase